MNDDANESPFDERTVAAVAADHGLEIEDLYHLVAAHQQLMANSPGVENLVYEWRKQFDATIRVRSDAYYFVDVPAWTWEEFGAHLDASDDEMAALAALHERTVDHDDAVDGTVPMVVRRE